MNGNNNILTLSGTFDPSHPTTELLMPDGKVLRLPTEILASHLESSTANALNADQPTFESSDPVLIPLIEESLTVGKRTVETGKVRLEKTVQEYHETLDESLAVRTFDIERVLLNQPVETAPPVRHEGDTTIYSLVEEQLILTKHLILKEEIRVTKRDTERRDTQVVTLRREHLTVEREPILHE